MKYKIPADCSLKSFQFQPEVNCYCHSESELVVVENREHLAKFLKVWDQLPGLKYIIVYSDDDLPADLIPQIRRKQVIQWKTLLELGTLYKHSLIENSLEDRMKSQKPGNVCTLVYTSGTTGQPKGVMLTHDNYLFPAINFNRKYNFIQNERIVSYLPLSHVAGQALDVVTTMVAGTQVFFANHDAVSGSLIQTLQEVRPTFFFSVPRVWEKIEQKMKLLASSNGFVKSSMTSWAQGLGKNGTYAETHNKSPPFSFEIAKSLVYQNVKKSIGLDKARYNMYLAAPLSPLIRNYFLSLNIPLINAYGTSESSGIHTISDPMNFDEFESDYLASTGQGIDGSETKIMNPDQEGNGEICYRGRHIFRGYLKNEQATRDTLDQDGYLHSGDVGRLDKRGNLIITGRIKEIIITAGGENIAPVLLENEVKKLIKFLSNCMVIGEARKFLAIVLTLKHVMDKNGKLTSQLENEVLEQFRSYGSKATNISEANKCPIIKKNIDELIEKANQKAISKAHYIRKWVFIDGDFTVDGGELTPTLKLKRKVVSQKNSVDIEKLYLEAHL